MNTVLDFRSFDPRFRSGLIFSVFEGLIQGQSIKIIFDNDPSELQKKFIEADISNIKWNINKLGENIWEVFMLKQKSQHSCCGVCGND